MELISPEEMKLQGYMHLSGYAVTDKLVSRVVDECPKVKAVPIEELQEIRAELTKHYVDPYNRNAFRYTTVSLLDVLDLIDKHIKEITNETNN